MKKRNIPIYKNELPDVKEGICISENGKDTLLNVLYDQYLNSEYRYDSDMYFIGIDAEEIGRYLDAVIDEIINIHGLICPEDSNLVGLIPKHVFCFDTEESCERFAGHYESLKDEEVIQLAGFEIKVLHTPGHTEGGCCYYIAEEDVVFTGDTLFAQSVGRTDFPGGSMSQIVRSIQEKLLTLNEAGNLENDIMVYPGHNDPTTIETERMNNPYL